jgi:quercetin dioxygenase-like cupin family protein
MSSQRRATVWGPDEGQPLAWLGERLLYKARGRDTGQAYALCLGRAAAGQGPPARRQTLEETGFYVLDGTLTFTAGSRTVIAGAGDFVNVSRGTAQVFVAGDSPAVFLEVGAPAGFDRFQFDTGHPLPAGAPVPPRSEADLVRLRAAAPRHGIELDLPPEAFTQPPQLTFTPQGQGTAYGVAGDLCVLKVGGDDTNGAYTLFDLVVPPGGGPPPHIHHREEEAFFVLSGELTFTLGGDGQRVRLGPGGFVNAVRDVPHTFRNEGRSPALAVLLAAPAGLEQFFAEVGTLLPNAETLPPRPTPAELARLKAVAPKYGLDILAP